ncbi:MAG: hypothetical protein N3C13_04430 [Aquificaceae bacterium]|nr:hypothetical protein [Aquificaceae bacterium]
MLRKLSLIASLSLGMAYAQTPQTHTLTVNKVGNGTGSVISGPAGINCGGTCSANFTTGANVTLQATPDRGSAFSEWRGDCASCGTNRNCTIIVDSNKSCIAEFVLIRSAPPISNPPPIAPNVDPAYTRTVDTLVGLVRLETSSQILSLRQSGITFSPPEGFVAPYGAIEFSLTTNTGYETVRLVFPRPIPAGSRLLKQVGGTLYDITSQADIRGSVVTFVVQDNSFMDTDLTPNVIRDPIVLLENTSPPAGGGGGGCSTGTGGGWWSLLAVALVRLFRKFRLRR